MSRGRTYILDPNTLVLRDTRSGKRIALGDFESSRPVVAVDPGHGVIKPNGVYDRGTETINGVSEAKITREMSRALAKELNALGNDVIITHDSSRQHAGDGFDFRNKAARESDVFISLHVDAAGNRSVSGSRVYANSDRAPGDDLRDIVAARKPGDHIHDRVDRHANHDVTRPRHVGRTPAILCELGFATNPKDARNLESASWRRQACRELARDIDDFVGGVGDKPEKRRKEDTPRSAPKYRLTQPDPEDAPRLFRHDIESGDTYRRLSKEYGVSVADLKRVNHGRVPRVGQQVIIPDVREMAVGKGDTLFEIAQNIALSDGKGGIDTSDVMKELKRLNPDIRKSSKIEAGEALIIPANAGSVHRMQQQRLT